MSPLINNVVDFPPNQCHQLNRPISSRLDDDDILYDDKRGRGLPCTHDIFIDQRAFDKGVNIEGLVYLRFMPKEIWL